MKIRNLNVFWRCFITYAICTFFFLCILFYSFSQMTKEWKESYTKQVNDSFLMNASAFSDDLFSVFYFHQAMGSSDYFNMVSNLSDISMPSHSYYVARVMSNIRNQRGSFRLTDESIIYLKKSGAVLTGNRFISSLEDCFRSDYKYVNLDVPAILAGIQKSNRSLMLCPVDSVTIHSDSPRDYLTLILNQNTENSICLFLIPAQKVTGAFQLDTLPEDTYFTLTDADDVILLSHGSERFEAADYIDLACSIQSIGGTVRLRIPASFFEGVTMPARRKVLFIFLIASLLGLAMCFFFSHISSMPVKQLIENADIPKESSSSNEFAAISSYLSQSKENRKKLQKQLLSILLARAFSGLPVSDSDIAPATDDSSLFRQPTCMAILHCPLSSENPDLSGFVLSELKKRLAKEYIFEALNIEEFGIVFPASDESVTTLENVIRELNQDPEIAGSLSCGVSASFVGIENIPDAVRQARFILPENGDILTVFSTSSKNPALFSGTPDLKSFQSALFNWNRNEVSRLLVIFAEAARKETPAYAQQIFYTLLASITDAADAISIPSGLFKECSFARSISAEANIKALQKLTDYLFEQKANLHADRKTKEKQDLIAYTDLNYGNSALSIGLLSGEFKKSEREINSSFLSETGLSFSSYLVKIRMQHAAVLLRDTELDAIEVSEKCGLALSTFYRNFKKAYGMTPVDYKKQFYAGKR